MKMFVEDAQFELVAQGTLPNLEAIQTLHKYDKSINTGVVHANRNRQSFVPNGSRRSDDAFREQPIFDTFLTVTN